MDAAKLSLSQAWQHVLHLRQCNWQQHDRYDIDGLTVSIGGDWQHEDNLSSKVTRLLDIMLPLVARREGLVLAQLGQSLDGRIATECGASYYVTGQEGLVHLHALRAVVDAVVVGAGTVATDDPRLTVRHVEGPTPVRVVLDPRGRVPETRVVFDDATVPTIHLVGEQHVARWQACHESYGRHVRVLGVREGRDGVAPHEVIRVLNHEGLEALLIEGGGLTISRFLQAGCLNRLHSMVTPMIIGSGRPTLTLPVIDSLSQALRPSARHFSLGNDVLFDLDLTDAFERND